MTGTGVRFLQASTLKSCVLDSGFSLLSVFTNNATACVCLLACPVFFSVYLSVPWFVCCISFCLLLFCLIASSLFNCLFAFSFCGCLIVNCLFVYRFVYSSVNFLLFVCSFVYLSIYFFPIISVSIHSRPNKGSLTSGHKVKAGLYMSFRRAVRSRSQKCLYYYLQG